MSGKKLLSVFAGVLLVAVIVVVVGVYLVTDHQKPHRPSVSLAVGTRLYQVEPYRYCDFELTSCDKQGKVARIVVEPGQSVVLTVPAQIARVWTMRTEYVVDGAPRVEQKLYTSSNNDSATYTVILQSTPHKQLTAIDIQTPSLVHADPAGAVSNEVDYVSRAQWSIDTHSRVLDVQMPEDFTN